MSENRPQKSPLSRAYSFWISALQPDLRDRLRSAIFILIHGKTGDKLVAVLFQLWLELFAGAEGAAAAGVERATGWRIQRAWQLAGQFDAFAAFVRVQTRRRGKQCLGVRMAVL